MDFGPFKRRAKPGVPADHFPKWHDRYIAVDHRGRVTALVAHGPETDVWDGPGFEHHGADGVLDPVACLAAICLLTAVNAKDQPWFGDRQAIYKHLIEHLKGTGADAPEDDLPDLDDMSLEDMEHWSAMHAASTVTHTHSHATYGNQGGDKTHGHQHSHKGDASHNHHSAASATAIDLVSIERRLALLEAHQVATPSVDRTLVKVHGIPELEGREIEMAVRWDDEAGEFVGTALTAAADMPQLVDNPGAEWHSYLCIEGVRTDEGYYSRELMPMACQFPDLPVSLRVQIEDQGGHYGAIPCGRIDTMDRVPYPEDESLGVILSSGVFGSDENGQTAQLFVTEQTLRFISIDPRDIDLEIVEITATVSTMPYAVADDGRLRTRWSPGSEVTHPVKGIGLKDLEEMTADLRRRQLQFDDDGCCECDDDDADAVFDWWVRFTSCVIGAATIVATPALQQAVITLMSVPLPTAPLALERAPSTSIVVTASGELACPPAEWFENPGFHVGDQRLVRQPDRRRIALACPSTVTSDGRVFGHACYWGQEHTALGRRITPPRSASYDWYMTGARPVMGADGPVKTRVGQITMGCGHAALSLNYHAAKAHYDGGYGAVQVADITVGEDDFGIWFAGALKEGVTPEQVRQFESLDLSPDWREVGGGLNMLAVLSVPVGGFPIARHALVASAADVEEHAGACAFTNDDGDVISLVAAGRVHRRPMEERVALIESRLDALLDGPVTSSKSDLLRDLADLLV